MKKIFINHHSSFFILHFSFFILPLLLLTSCDKVPINGDLDGFWQVTTIQVSDDVRDVRPAHSYLSFQLHLSQWDHAGIRYYAHFAHEGDSIRFYDFAHSSLHRSKADDNEWITEQEMRDGIMDAWGVHNLDARYRVRQLDGDAMVLERADTVLFFVKI